ncbi:MAG: outer membrane lipoprotein carrier protein LolA [Gammaproteobacteria bacterium]|nr:MAG: outer membrane lipoprotein carrier protein LolA [Gammaproteobacteria bacterium]RLA52685.1 MAG: outer membrane lipoprotein carrier protein LolA [Gammaproteobacteria bacterium]
MNRCLLVFVVLLMPNASYAELSFEQMETLSSMPPSLKGEFTQEKYLSSLDALLVSTGTFSFQRDKSISWKTLEPIKSELLMTPTSIVSRQGARELARFEASSNPALSIFSELLFAVLTAEWEMLSNYFELTGQLKGEQWQAILIPVDTNIAQVVSRVELRGGTLLDELILHEGNGDFTKIHFRNRE